MPEGESYPRCFDPYLRYAISTQFRDFEFFKEHEGFRLFLLVELWKDGKADEFAAKLNEALSHGKPPPSELDVELGPADDNTRYAAMRARKKAVTDATVDATVFGLWDTYVSRVELSLPLKPASLKPDEKAKVIEHRWQKVKQPPGPLLIGILDDGCPFAATQFLRSLAPAASTRVLAIWDQDQYKNPVTITDNNANQFIFGQTPPDFQYGLEFWRDFANPGGPPPQIGFDDLMKLRLTPMGSIDGDSCYPSSIFRNLTFRESHGAHVLDVLAGRIPTSSRIGPTQPGRDRRDPPSWAVGTDPATRADIVFVQFPENGIRDATGVWLKLYVLNGIEYILSFAGPQAERVIINLSYGPTTGPHDGTAVLEMALSALVAQYNGTGNKPKLEIFLPAGNSYLSEGHVFYFRDEGKPGQIEWTWRLLPDNPVLCFSEVWMERTQSGSVTVTLTPPGGGAPQVINPQAWGNTNTMWRLEVGPTIVKPGSIAAPHGNYTITVSGIPQGAQVDAYVARTSPNLDVRTLAKGSYFVDPPWQQTQSAAASCTYVDGEFDKKGSLVSRYGTLNGIATAKDPSVHVAGGYMLINRRKAPYASAGPARGNPNTRRVGPDFALLCDESYALQGVRADGTRSGAVFRLIGTSVAAPQLARLVAASASLVPPVPTTTLKEQEQRGDGNLAPP